MSYRHHPFGNSRKRKKKPKRESFSPRKKNILSVLDKGSWYDQKKLESEHLFVDSANTSEEIISSSQRKINNAITVEKGSDDSDV